MNKEDDNDNKQIYRNFFLEILLIFIGIVGTSIVSHFENFITFKNPDYYKLLLSLLNLIVVLIFFQFSIKKFKLEFTEDNSRDKEKRKDKSKRKYWKSLNIEVKNNFVEIDNKPVNYLKQARKNEERVNLLVGQLHRHIHFYAAFLFLVYLLFIFDNETLFLIFNGRDEYNWLHPFLKIGEDVFNLWSALFIFLGFKVLYDKTLDEKNNETGYTHGPFAFAAIVTLLYLFFIVISHYPSKTYEITSINDVDIIVKSINETIEHRESAESSPNQDNKPDTLKKLSLEEEEKFKELKTLSFDYSVDGSESPFLNIKRIIKEINEADKYKQRNNIEKEIISYRKQQNNNNNNIEIFASLFQLLIGVYNGLAMALLFGKYILMEERVRGINKIKYKNLFTKATVYILPIYALSQPLFGSFNVSAFGSPKMFADGVFFFCLIGKIFFLYSTYWFMKNRLMHYYLHLVLTSHGVPKDFYTCFDYKHKNLIDQPADMSSLSKANKLKNKYKALIVKTDASVVELPTNQSVSDEEILNIWADREESAQELARKIRKGNRKMS